MNKKTFVGSDYDDDHFVNGFLRGFCGAKNLEWKEEIGISSGQKYFYVIESDLSNDLDFLARNGIEAWVEKN